MHYEDLTSYDYVSRRLTKVVKNVGWLDSAHAFPRASSGSGIVEILERRFSELSANQMRGIFQCPFCSNSDEDEPFIIIDGIRYWIGSCELWVPGETENDPVYAAPGLVIHYIREHMYAPPEEFVSAVLAFEAGNRDWNPESIMEPR